jgi:hypothetical protein
MRRQGSPVPVGISGRSARLLQGFVQGPSALQGLGKTGYPVPITTSQVKDLRIFPRPDVSGRDMGLGAAYDEARNLVV